MLPDVEVSDTSKDDSSNAACSTPVLLSLLLIAINRDDEHSTSCRLSDLGNHNQNGMTVVLHNHADRRCWYEA